MKKIRKSLILFGILAIIISFGCILQIETEIDKEVEENKLQTYNHNASNILDNVFIEGNTRYLPFIFDSAYTSANKSEFYSISPNLIKTQFASAGLEIASISTGNTIGTGTEITTKDGLVYNVLIYGDVSGNGIITLQDVQKIILHYIDSSKQLTGIYLKAANLNNKTEAVNLGDVQRLILFYSNTLSVDFVTVEPSSAKEVDKVAPVITLKGADTITLEVSQSATYTDQGVLKVEDAYDGSIAVSKVKNISTEAVNPRKIGTYYVKYSVKDTAGNIGYKTRTINVVDTTAPEITITSNIFSITVGEAKPTFSATATDNSGETITVKISDNIDVNVPKDDYKVTFIATDSSGKTKTITKDFVVKNAIDSIEIDSTNPPKTTYIYGATNVELNNARIKINWKYGDPTYEPITETMLSSTILPETGSKDITVTYKEKYQVTFTVTVYELILLENIEDYEVRANSRSVIKKLTVKNTNNEEIDITSDEISFEFADDINGKISITKLNDSKEQIPETNTKEFVKYLKITTIIEEQTDNVAFTIVVQKEGETEATKKEISFKIGAKSYLNDVKIGSTEGVSQFDVYVEEQTGDNIKKEDEMIYTILPIYFLDQYGDNMDIQANQIKEMIASSTNSIESGKVAVILPKVTKISSEGTENTVGTGVDVKFYTQSGLDAGDGETIVSKIGLAIGVYENQEVVLSTLDGQNLTVAWNELNTKYTVPIKVNYKELASLIISEDPNIQKNLSKAAEGTTEYNYEVNVGKEFVLGTIKEGDNEAPLTTDIIQTTIETTVSYENTSDVIEINYVKDGNNTLVKGLIKKAGIYSIKPNVTIGGKTISSTPTTIKLKAITVANTLELYHDNNLIQNETETETVTVNVTKDWTEKVQIIAKYIDESKGINEIAKISKENISLIYTETEGVTIKLVDEYGDEVQSIIDECYLSILVESEIESFDITIKLYEGQENEIFRTINITVTE